MSTFPQSWADCPPGDAADAQGIVFRRVLANPFDGSSFLTFAEMGRSVPAALKCQGLGLSVFRKLSDARHYAKRYPTSGSLVAAADLAATDGKIKATPTQGNSHHTWWVYEGVTRHLKFKLVD